MHTNEFHRATARATRGSYGMSLIEIMVVLTIISMIVGGIAVVAFGQFSKAQIRTADQQVRRIQSAIEIYRTEKRGKCPKTLQDLKASGAIQGSVQDPWGKDFEFKCPGEKLSVDVYSAGPDGEMGNEDDIANYKDEAEEQPEE